MHTKEDIKQDISPSTFGDSSYMGDNFSAVTKLLQLLMGFWDKRHQLHKFYTIYVKFRSYTML